MQAYCCIDLKTGRKIRWCSTHGQWEPLACFSGYFRTCQGRRLPATSDEAVEAARVAAAVAADADDAGEEETWNPEWGRQSMLVHGQDACAQLKGHLGYGVTKWAARVLGRDLSAIDEEDNFVEEAVRKLYDDDQAPRELTATGTPLPPAPASRTCAICDQYTCPAGFVGQSVCLTCAARGRGAGGLSMIDVNHALVTGLLYGKGVWPQPCRCMCFGACACVSVGAAPIPACLSLREESCMWPPRRPCVPYERCLGGQLAYPKLQRSAALTCHSTCRPHDDKAGARRPSAAVAHARSAGRACGSVCRAAQPPAHHRDRHRYRH